MSAGILSSWLSGSSFPMRTTRASAAAPRVTPLEEIPRWTHTAARLQRAQRQREHEQQQQQQHTNTQENVMHAQTVEENSKSAPARSSDAARLAAETDARMEDDASTASTSAAASSSAATAAAAAALPAAGVAAQPAAQPVEISQEEEDDDDEDDEEEEDVEGEEEDLFTFYRGRYQVDAALNDKVRLFRGDITRLRVDAVTNAANTGLYAGGGICGAIFDAAGEWKLAKACRQIRQTTGPCPPGETRLTRGFGLPAPYILHTVGPMDGDDAVLEAAYVSALDMCVEPQLLDAKQGEEIRIRSVALCCISTGIYGFDNVAAAEIALRTTREWLQQHPAKAAKLDAIVFCVFLQKDLEIYEELMPLFFPTEETPSANEEETLQSQQQLMKAEQKEQHQRAAPESKSDSPAAAAAAAAAASSHLPVSSVPLKKRKSSDGETEDDAMSTTTDASAPPSAAKPTAPAQSGEHKSQHSQRSPVEAGETQAAAATKKSRAS